MDLAEKAVRVLGRESLRARFIRTRSAAGGQEALLRFDNGDELWVPTAMEGESAGTYYLPLQLERTPSEAEPKPETEQTIPLAREESKVGKRKVKTGTVRIDKRVHERDELVDVPVFTEDVHIERVPINEIVTEPAGSRTEGDEVILPLFEEVLVVEKRLLLKEELHIRRQKREMRNPQRVRLRSEEVSIERRKGQEGSTDEGEGPDQGC